MARTTSQCAWCPWDCPSPEVAACRTIPAATPEVLRGVLKLAQTPAEGLCEPAWRVKAARRTVDVIRDIADYSKETET